MACVLELALRQVIEPSLLLPEEFQLVRALGGVEVDRTCWNSRISRIDRVGRWVRGGI